MYNILNRNTSTSHLFPKANSTLMFHYVRKRDIKVKHSYSWSEIKYYTMKTLTGQDYMPIIFVIQYFVTIPNFANRTDKI